MPPGSSQKGTGKKGAGAIRQRSRNTTPSAAPPSSSSTASLPPIDLVEAEYLELTAEIFRNLVYDDLIDQTASNAMIPDSKSLDGMISRLSRLGETLEKRSNFCDRSMRLLAGFRKHARVDDILPDARGDDDRVRTDDERDKKANKKKRKHDALAPPQDANLGMLPHYWLCAVHPFRNIHETLFFFGVLFFLSDVKV